MNRKFTSVPLMPVTGTAIVLLLVVLTACSGPITIQPLPSSFLVTTQGDVARVTADSISADPGSTVSITSGGTGSGIAAADGSVQFQATVTEALVTIQHVISGATLEATAVPVALSSRVTPAHFATGAAPNDLERADGNLLVVANSLDNTVTTFNSSGQEVAEAVLPQFASPSYLAYSNGTVVVTRNGDNVVSSYDVDTMEEVGQPATLVDASAAFIGPGKPAFDGRFAFVPRAQITNFSPTAYGEGLISVIDTTTGEVIESRETTGRNAIAATLGVSTADTAPRQQSLYVTSAGEVHFDENFQPLVTTDSFLDVFDISASGSLTLVDSVNLGRIGAGSVVVNGFHLLTSGDAELPVYVASLISGDVYVLDLLDTNPAPQRIELTSETTFISDLTVADDHLLATSFNTDELFLIDLSTLTVNPGPYLAPFMVSADPDLLAGAQAVEVVQSGNGSVAAFVLLGIANAAARVELF